VTRFFKHMNRQSLVPLQNRDRPLNDSPSIGPRRIITHFDDPHPPPAIIDLAAPIDHVFRFMSGDTISTPLGDEMSKRFGDRRPGFPIGGAGKIQRPKMKPTVNKSRNE